MQIKCDECGKTKEVYPSYANRSKLHFCCNICKKAYFDKHPELLGAKNKVEEKEFTCINCGVVGKSKNHNRKFCNNKCRLEYQRKKMKGL